MIIGDSYYGKVDRVPGLFHVTTRFLHVCWIPLVPRGTYLMLEGTKDRRGFRIPLSWKSMIKAYVFGFATMLAILGFGVPVMLYFEKGGFSQPRESNAMMVLGIQATLAFAVACWFARTPLANAERAMELGSMAGIQREAISEALNVKHRKRRL